MKFAVVVVTLTALAGTASAQNIRWNQVTPGNMDWSGKLSEHNVVIQNRIGNLVYGSDGSRTYAPVKEDDPKPDARFYQRNPDGSTSMCVRYGETVFCQPK